MLLSTQTSYAFSRFGAIEGCKRLADAGFLALDLSLFDDECDILSSDFRKNAFELREYAKSRGIVFTQAHAPYGRTIDYYLSNALTSFATVFEVCSILDIPYVVVHPLKESDESYAGNEEKLFELNLSFFSALIPLSEYWGVKIAIENVFQTHRASGKNVPCICSAPDEHIRLYEALSHSGCFALCFDIGHSAITGNDPADAIRLLGRERIKCIHVHDNDYVADRHMLPGACDLDFESICRALAEIGYDERISLECDYSIPKDIPEEDLEAAFKAMLTVGNRLCRKIEQYRSVI